MNFLRSTFSSLSEKNFRYFWIGQCISVMGTWVQRTAQTWLVYQMTKSAFKVGLLSAFQFIPILALTLVAGTLIDRFPKRTILLVTQFGFLILGAIMTTLVYLKIVQYWEILLIALGYGILQSFDTPTRQSFVVELVGQKNLMNGISLNSTIFNLAKIAGPSLAGLLMVQFSVSFCFLVDTISYVAVLFGLFLIQQKNVVASHSHERIWSDVKDGLSYVWRHSAVRLSAELMLVVCTLNYNNNVIIPIFAKTVLHSGAQTYANLLSATGIGSLIAAFLMSYLSRFGLQRNIYLYVGVGTAALQAAMIFVHTYWMAMLMMVLIGFCNMIFLNQSNASFQFSIPNELRGRIMSVYVLLNQGTTPVGSLFVGGIMDVSSGFWGFPACGFLALLLLAPVLIKNRPLVTKWLHPKTEN
ncbi:MFS transporter permease [Loigolactobacillus backii]|uniref:MFS transporter n=1 Tax=Loigolactobacillus backii TaxID=375175 RepID=UPI0007F1497C|nr:MFS transporter [Loigolactobacillus backii]ANK60186.1 MFS transporter permease [Loigolactobacillus backii]ANK65068.1 MFS transporter permease [Loigolactobacillus backii]ANK67624.1 MFS transporter permease [Loigolactobacillus backii]OLF70105.1 MFS transporter permease [Loigolactobacillus backii]PIO87147.1 MFS transporter [Loigolactobacillus backii]